MPSDIATLAIEVSSDSVTQATQRLGALPGAASQSEKAIDSLASSAKSAGEAATNLSEQVQHLNQTLAQETLTASEASAATAKLAPAEEAATGATAALEAELARLKLELQNVGSSSNVALAGLNTVRDGLLRIRSITLAGGLVAGVGYELAKMSFDFDQAINKIIGLTDLGAQHMDQFRAAIAAMSISTGTNQTDLANALYLIGSAGENATQALDTLNTAAKASEAGLGSVDTIARAIATSVNAYGQANLTTAQSADVLLQTTKLGTVQADELAGVLGRVLPAAAAAGVGFKDVGAAMAGMTRQGISAAQAATALRSLLLEIEKPSQGAARELSVASEGTLTFQEMADELKKPGGLLTVLEQLNKLTGDSPELLARILPNLRALTGAQAELGNNMEKTKSIFEEMNQSAGSLNKTLDAESGSASIEWTKHWAAIKDAAKSGGDVILQVVNDGATAFGSFFQSVKEDAQVVAYAINLIPDAVKTVADKLKDLYDYSNSHQINLSYDGKATFPAKARTGATGDWGGGSSSTWVPDAAAAGTPGATATGGADSAAVASTKSFNENTAILAATNPLIDKQRELTTAINEGGEAYGRFQAAQKIYAELTKDNIAVTDQNRGVINAQIDALGHQIALEAANKAATKEDNQFDKMVEGMKARISTQEALNDSLFKSKDIQAQVRAEFEAMGELQSRNLKTTADQRAEWLKLADAFSATKQAGAELTAQLQIEAGVTSTFDNITTGLNATQRKQIDNMELLKAQFAANPVAFGVSPIDTAGYVAGLAQIQHAEDQLTSPEKVANQKKYGDQFISSLDSITTNAITATGGVKGLAEIFGDLAQSLEKALVQLLIVEPIMLKLKGALAQDFPAYFTAPGTTANAAPGAGQPGGNASTLGSGFTALGGQIKSLFMPVLTFFGIGVAHQATAATTEITAATALTSAATALNSAAAALASAAGGGMAGSGSSIGQAFDGIFSGAGSGDFGGGEFMDPSGLTPFADGGIVEKPTFFSHSGGRGVAGESGHEAIMPVRRLPNGQMGVGHDGKQGGGDVNVVINNTNGSKVDQDHSKDRNGNRSINLTISDMMGQEVRGGGELGRSIGATFGGSRKPIQR